MSSSLNKVFLMGNLTRDPELKYTATGKALVSFGIAVSRSWTDDLGQKKEDVCFVDVGMFGKRAEIINEYFGKGSPIFIEGRLRFRQWETPDGQKRNALSVNATDFQFIGQTKKGGKKKEETTPGMSPSASASGPIDEEEIPF